MKIDNNTIVILTVVLVVLLLFGGAGFGFFNSRDMMYSYSGFNFLINAIFVILLIFLGIYAINKLKGGKNNGKEKQRR